MTETVTRLRATSSVNGHGSTVLDWSAPATLDIAGADVAWAAGLENFGKGRADTARDASVADGTVYLPGSPDVLSTDRLRVRGLDYEVIGRPGDWNDLGGSTDVGGTVVTIQRVDG